MIFTIDIVHIIGLVVTPMNNSSYWRTFLIGEQILLRGESLPGSLKTYWWGEMVVIIILCWVVKELISYNEIKNTFCELFEYRAPGNLILLSTLPGMLSKNSILNLLSMAKIDAMEDPPRLALYQLEAIAEDLCWLFK